MNFKFFSKRAVLILSLFLCSLFVFSYSCKKGGETSQRIEEHDETEENPSITSATATCFSNSTVVIKGKNFSDNKNENIVEFGTKKAEVIDATKTSLTVKTPPLASQVTSINLTVTKSGKTSNTFKIEVDEDQEKIATYNWTADTVRAGLIYKTGTFRVFDGNKERRFYILDVNLDEANTLHVGFVETNKSTVDICNDYAAVAGINAGYFPFGEGEDKDPYIRIDGNIVQAGHSNVKPLFTNSALLIKDKAINVKKFNQAGKNLNLVAAQIPLSEANDVIVCGPMLIKSNEIEGLNMKEGHNNSNTGRTGLGVSGEGNRVIMVVVDHDNTAAKEVTGTTTLQLAKTLQALGACDAMNFDGGGSSTMFVKNRGGNGRVNYPYGGTYQRPVKSVIYVK